MRKLPAFSFLGIAALAVAGTALAAGRDSHVMAVALPDGWTARVEYVGEVPPKVTIEPFSHPALGNLAPLPSFAGFDRLFDELNRQTEAMMREAEQARRGAVSLGAVPFVASLGAVPEGVTSTTIVSYSNGASTCTRTTQTVSRGTGKPPVVRTTVSGNCASSTAPARDGPSQDLSHT